MQGTRHGARSIWTLWEMAWHGRPASPRVVALRATLDLLLQDELAGLVLLLGGTAVLTLIIAGINRVLVPLPNPGVIYLPLTAMLAYFWGWVYGVGSAALVLACVYVFFIDPVARLKPLGERDVEQLTTLLAVSVFVLLLTQLARTRRVAAEREAGRFAALNRIGTAVAGELDESRLLDLIARTARDLTGAQFAAFSLRPLDPFGAPLVPAEGNLFHLAAVVGVSPEQEALFGRMPLGGEGLLAPIFRHGHPVLVEDALQHTGAFHSGVSGELVNEAREGARAVAGAFARGQASSDQLRSLGVPRGHPVVRSFLGAPLLDRRGEVRGGLLLGHNEPGRFTQEDQVLLIGLASQAAVALENARLYHAAQTQAEELDAVFESIGEGITVIDDAGHVVRENAASQQLRAVLEQAGDEADAHDVLTRAAARVQAAETGGESSVEVPIAPGDTRAYTVSAAPLRPAPDRVSVPREGRADARDTQRSAGAVVVWHDVTEARRLLDEQRRSAEAETRRALLQTVIGELPSGVCLVRGLDARLVLANRAAAEVWGAPWQEGIPMHQFLEQCGTRILSADGRELAPQDWATLRTLRTGENVRHYQEVIRQVNGRALPVLYNAVAVDMRSVGLADPDEVHSGYWEPAALLVLQDVTALKEAERLKDEFIGIAAHELRNPMAALRGYAQMLEVQTARGKGAPLADWQQEAVEAIDQATARLVDLTDDLLDVTRLQGGRLELRIEPADLVALVRRVAARVQVTAPGRSIAVVAGADYVVAALDVARLEQVVTNLLNNAIKYSPSGGEISVTVEEHDAEEMACLAVHDEGIGIPAEQQSRIFGRFVRADNAKRGGISGTGLGLYLCRELVERHGGHIWFDSEEGHGSTFHVELPTSCADSPQVPPDANGRHDSSKAGRHDAMIDPTVAAEGDESAVGR